MGFEDRYGNAITCATSQAQDHYIAGVDHLLSSTYGGVEAFEAAVTADPQFALGFVGLARANMVAGDMAAARQAIGTAVSLNGTVSDRERDHMGITQALISGDALQARELTEAHVLIYPRDALIAQLCTSVFGLIAFSGCDATEAQMFGYTSWLAPHYGEDWWMMAVHAVSICEVGQPQKALELMERSLALNPRNANASHFKAHCLYETGETQQGLAYLTDWMTGYDRRSVIYGHLSWHKALWALSEGDTATMWEIFDAEISPKNASGLPINILTDSASLLYRADLAGHHVSAERWKELSAYAADRFAQPGQSFVDMHSALCHAMAGETDALERYLSAPKGFAGDLVAPVAKAWARIVRHDWPGALEHLTPVMTQHARFGGSRAQRDMLELTYLNVLLRLGKRDEARRAASTRRALFMQNAPLAMDLG